MGLYGEGQIEGQVSSRQVCGQLGRKHFYAKQIQAVYSAWICATSSGLQGHFANKLGFQLHLGDLQRGGEVIAFPHYADSYL